MPTNSFRRSTGVFDETETERLRDAYLLALESLAMTRKVDEMLKARLADIVLAIYTAEKVPGRRHAVDTSGLATRSVARYLSFHTLERIGRDALLH